MLKRIKVNSFSICFIVLYISLESATVIEYISSLSLSYSITKTSLIVRTIFKEKFSTSMKLITCPFSMIISLGFADFLIGLTICTLRKQSGIVVLIGRESFHLFSNKGSQCISGHFFSHNNIGSLRFSHHKFFIVFAIFVSTALILLTHCLKYKL